MISPLNDKHYVHRAHVTSLTSRFVPGQGFVLPTTAAQCTGRVGWDWDHSLDSHPFMELYRGYDEDEAKRICAEHNAEYHPVSLSPGARSGKEDE